MVPVNSIDNIYNCGDLTLRFYHKARGSIQAKRYQQIRNGATSCSEIRHQQTWQPLLC